MKYTTEQAMESEKIQLIDALGNCIELNDEFLDQCAGDELKVLLKSVPESDREFFLQSHIDEDKAFFNGGIPSLSNDDFLLNVSEIEVQFEGEASDHFENIDDWHIDGDLAYLNVGYGLTIPVDLVGLKQEIEESTEA